MKKPIEYAVFFCDEEVGRTMAVSPAQAINNFRFTNGGALGMWQEGTADGYSAFPTVALKFWEENARCRQEESKKRGLRK